MELGRGGIHLNLEVGPELCSHTHQPLLSRVVAQRMECFVSCLEVLYNWCCVVPLLDLSVRCYDVQVSRRLKRLVSVVVMFVWETISQSQSQHSKGALLQISLPYLQAQKLAPWPKPMLYRPIQNSRRHFVLTICWNTARTTMSLFWKRACVSLEITMIPCTLVQTLPFS